MRVGLLGPGADGPLDATRSWVDHHTRMIAVVIEVVFAAHLIVKGVEALP